MLFQRLLQNLKPTFAINGFKKKSQNFISESSDCWGVINFQKSRYSNSNEKSFTLNLAVAAKRILAYCGEPANAAPPEYACHWHIRIGELMLDRKDKWWVLADESSFIAVETELQHALSQLAIPKVKQHLTEQGLQELWASKTPGSWEYPNLKNKSILLALDKKADELLPVLNRIREICKGTHAEAAAEQHIDQIMKSQT